MLTHACGEPYHGYDGYNDPEYMKLWNSPVFTESKKRCRALEHRAYRAGIRIGVGTDLLPGEDISVLYRKPDLVIQGGTVRRRNDQRV